MTFSFVTRWQKVIWHASSRRGGVVTAERPRRTCHTGSAFFKNRELRSLIPQREAERDDIVFRIAEPKVHAWLLTTHSDSREWQENIALFLGLRSDLGGEACCAQPSESMLGRTRAVAPTCAGSLPTQSGCSTALCQCTRPVPSPVHMYHCR